MFKLRILLNSTPSKFSIKNYSDLLESQNWICDSTFQSFANEVKVVISLVNVSSLFMESQTNQMQHLKHVIIHFD